MAEQPKQSPCLEPSGTTGPADAPQGACSQHQTPDANCRRCVAGPADAINHNRLREHFLAGIDAAVGGHRNLVELQFTLGEAGLLYSMLLERAAARGCIGYPECDGDLVATPHSQPCPKAGPADAGSHDLRAALERLVVEMDEAEAGDQEDGDSHGAATTAVWSSRILRILERAASASAPAVPRETTKENADMSPGNPASDGDEHPPSTPNARAIARRIVERIVSETLDYRGRVHFKSGWAERIIEQELSK
jgi:hypothetical protein